MIKFTLTRTQLNRLNRLMPNLLDYVDRFGEIEPGANAYRFGMRTLHDIDTVVALVRDHSKVTRKTIAATLPQALVIRDRLEFAWEIASDNGADGDSDQARLARSYRAGVKAIDAAIWAANAG